jgi:hypothetical protein
MSNDRPRYRRYQKLARSHVWSKWLNALGVIVTRLTSTPTNRSVTASVASNGLTCTAHGFAVGDGPLRFSARTGTVATAFAAATDYWVSAVPDANTFRLSAAEAPLADATVAAGVGTGTIARTVTNTAIRGAARRKGFDAVRQTSDIDSV